MRTRRLIWITLLAALIFTGTASARQIVQGSRCHIETDEVIEGTLFALCEDLIVDGEVRGAIIGAALRARISGTVSDSVYLAAGQLVVTGRVDGSLHALALSVTLRIPDGQSAAEDAPYVPVAGRLMALAFSVTVMEDVHIGTEIVMGGYQLIVQGQVNQDIHYWGSALVIEGFVGGSIDATTGDPAAGSGQLQTLLLPLAVDLQVIDPGLRVSESGIVSGDLRYDAPAAGLIDGTIGGETTFTMDQQVIIPTFDEPSTVTVYLIQVIRELSTLVIVGLLVLLLVPGVFRYPLRRLRYQPFSSFGFGLLAFILSFPTLLILTVLTTLALVVLLVLRLDGVATVVGVIAGLVNVGGGTFFYFVAVFIGRALTALAMGDILLRLASLRIGRPWYAISALFLGSLLLSVVASLPVLGVIANAGALFLGLGALLGSALNQFQSMRQRRGVPGEPIPVATSRMHNMPPPSVPMLPQDTYVPPKTGPGMDNLPEGFDFSFFREDKPEGR